MKRSFLLSLIAAVIFPVAQNAFAVAGPKITQIGNKHNLSFANSAVAYRATNPNDPRGRQICIFCHTPHNASTTRALWNRRDTQQTFGHYSTSNLKIHTNAYIKNLSEYGEPNGSSRLCLSCHDGVTAIGAVIRGRGTGNIEINNNAGTAMAGEHVFDRAKITSGHHPISFVFNQAVADELNKYTITPFTVPPQNGKIRLDGNSRMQCNTCHNPHQTQDTAYPFWVLDSGEPNSHDAVCKTCHNIVLGDPRITP